VLASPSIQSALLALNAPAGPEISASGAMPGTGFDLLLAASTPTGVAMPPAAPVAALPPGGNTLPVSLTAIPTAAELSPVQAYSVDPPEPAISTQPQARPAPGAPLPRTLAGTASRKLAGTVPHTPDQAAGAMPTGEQKEEPFAQATATLHVTPTATIAVAVSDPMQTQLAVPLADATIQPGLHHTAQSTPSEPDIVHQQRQQMAPAQPAVTMQVDLAVAANQKRQVSKAPVPDHLVQPGADKPALAPQPPGLFRAAEVLTAAALPLVRRGSGHSPARQPVAMFTELQIDLSPRAMAPAVQLKLDPALLRPVPGSDAIVQLSGAPMEPTPPISTYIGPARSAAEAAQPLDFAALIDRIESAREAGGNAPVHFALRHADFGPVSLRVETDAGRISVDLSSPDPDFARAVAAAQPAASDAPRAETGRSDSQRSESSARGQDAPTGNAREGSGSSRGSSDERANRTPAGHRTAANSGAKATPDHTDLFA
jgi:hypothetical protein